jgi:hypothetical protein
MQAYEAEGRVSYQRQADVTAAKWGAPCMGAKAYVHEYPAEVHESAASLHVRQGGSARISGVIACTPGRTCKNTAHA